MSKLLVYDHYPQINQKDIPINPEIKVYFDKEIDQSSITSRTVSLNDKNYVPVDGALGYSWTNEGTPSGILNILTFKPDINLVANAKYTFYVHKQPSSVIAADSTVVEETYKFTFYTGSTLVEDSDISYIDQLYLDLQKAIDEENWLEAARIQALIDEYEANGGSGIIPEVPDLPGLSQQYMQVVTQEPAAGSTNQKYKHIKLTFNDELLPTGNYTSGVYTGQYDMSDFMSLSYKHVLE